jgi:pimeloyl-ACP methyl ester carboxylesterase
MLYIAILIALLLLSGPAITYARFQSEITEAKENVLTGSEILKTDQGEIEYAVKGEGPPVLVLHGAGGGYDQGLLLGKSGFGKAAKFISVSRFGYLRSPLPEDSSVEAQAALYSILLDHLQIESVVVAAGSAGGPSALQFAHDYPDKCTALILVSAISMSIAPDKDAFNTRVIHSIQKSDFIYWGFTKVFRSLFLQLIGVPPKVYKGLTLEQKELAQELLDVMHPMSQRRTGSKHEFEIEPLASASMREISVPTLILHARDDALVSYEHAEFAHRNIAQSKLVLFETGGHGLLSRVNEARKHVSTFLSEQVPSLQQ